MPEYNYMQGTRFPSKIDETLLRRYPKQVVDYYNDLVDYVVRLRVQNRIDLDGGGFILIGRQLPGVTGDIVKYDSNNNVVTIFS